MRVVLNVVQGRGAPRLMEIEATSEEAARHHAAAQGYAVISSRPVGLRRSGWLAKQRAREQFDVSVFVEQLRDLLVAGLSVIEALEALHRGSKEVAGRTIGHLSRSLREGQPLSAAFGAHPAFPPLLVALVRSSELTSNLPQTLSRFLEHHQRVTELRHRLVSTAIYPLLLMAAGGAVLLFLLFYVVPRFARVFEGMAGELPWSATAMVAWSHGLSLYGTWIQVAMIAVALVVVSFARSANMRQRALQRLIGWGPMRGQVSAYFLARWYRTTGMLVQGGIPLPQALSLSNGLLPASMALGGESVLSAVNAGHSPSDAHVRAGMATPVAEHLLLAGERAGDLGGVLTRIAQFHEADVGRTMERTMRTIEPVVMALIGIGVGVVVVLMYMPIFELAAAIQ